MTRVADLTGAELALWVAKAAGHEIDAHGAVYDGDEKIYLGHIDGSIQPFAPHEDWAQGGPIIERERIDIDNNRARTLPVRCRAIMDNADQKPLCRRVDAWGPTPLIAAMRAFVASKFGEEVEMDNGLKISLPEGTVGARIYKDGSLLMEVAAPSASPASPVYGCHNRQRPTAETSYVAQTAFTVVRDGFGAPLRLPVYVDIKHTLSTNCRYDLSAADQRCAGCAHGGAA